MNLTFGLVLCLYAKPRPHNAKNAAKEARQVSATFHRKNDYVAFIILARVNLSSHK